MDRPQDWIVPQWPAPAHVQAVFTTRAGGVSQGPFDSFNVGAYVRDDPGHVQANRDRLSRIIGARPVFMRQVHGHHVLKLEEQAPGELVADASVTRTHRLACTVLAADCLSVLLTDRHGCAVAAAHAGWRGLAGQGGRGVLDSVVNSLRAALPPGQHELLAWLGPCIGPQSFEVGTEVRQAFVDAGLDVTSTFLPGAAAGKWFADLPALARQSLLRAGVAEVHGNDGTPAWCTFLQESRFFSHRRDAVRLGSSGRMAACIWLAD